MAFQHLLLVSGVHRPQPASLVARRRDNLSALGVEAHLRDFSLVTLQDGRARSREHIVNSSETVSTCGGELVASAVETRIQDLVVVAPESLDALSTSNIPKFARAVNRAGNAIVASEVKLRARQLALVPF